MLIASRELRLTTPDGDFGVPVRIFAPEAIDGQWRCRCEIDWPEGPWVDETHGFDAVQALVLALHGVGVTLYRSEAHASGRLGWLAGPGDYGFPVLSGPRDYGHSEDRMLLDPASIGARFQRDKVLSRNAAETIMQVVYRQMDELGELVRAIEPRCNGEEFNEYKRGIFHCLGAMVFEVLNPIVRRYPDLEPNGPS
jgi:hypothetical protein